MSIKPVDLQVMIPKTSEVSRIQNDEASKYQAIQQQQNSSAQHVVEESFKHVYKKDEAQEALVRERQERQNKGEKDKKKKNKGTYSSGGLNNKQKEDELRTSTIDIKI